MKELCNNNFLLNNKYHTQVVFLNTPERKSPSNFFYLDLKITIEVF